jgi:3-methyladenine DNA glycosylase AlkD
MNKLQTAEEIILLLKENGNPKNVEGMARFGINPETALGITIAFQRNLAKQISKDHKLAQELWKSGIHEARILSTIIDEPDKVTKSQMDKYVNDFNSWDLCDQCCNNLFWKTDFAIEKSFEWIENEKEFIRRAGFVIIAVLSVHNKQMTNKDFLKYFPLIEKYSIDERNFVKKAINWALRQIGKRNLGLNKEAIKLCKKIISLESKSAKWIAKDALRELTSEKTLSRIS